MEATEKCPSCGENMEFGYLVSPRRISWCKKIPRFFGICGDHLSEGFVFKSGVSGYRCKKCRLIRYNEIVRSPKNETDDWPAG